MTSNMFSFRARARTIDHLGKGQIADTPTAVSELWKNSYDAYARDVALHTYDGERMCGSIIDNGCGMTIKQLIESWLVVGTESKSNKKPVDDQDMFGLEKRHTQGEKGIGRLSSAFLSPVTLLVTKKRYEMFSAVLIDWRMFENPYLSLEEVIVPMQQFDDLSELPCLCSEMQSDLVDALLNQVDEEDPENPWVKFTKDELDLYGERHIPTIERIKCFSRDFVFDRKLVVEWSGLLDKVSKEDGDSHGTALYLLDLNRDLSLLTDRKDRSSKDDELLMIKDSVIDTLRAFVNPFEKDSIDFNYEVVAFGKSGEPNVVLSHQDSFTDEDFSKLEHRIDGEIDEKGWFRGNVIAFGKDRGPVVLKPRVVLDGQITKAGPFAIKLGTFELDISRKLTSLSEQDFTKLLEKSYTHSGFLIFRDNLRVLPYGRTDNDFFRIEERRGKNAGRYYWANRRLFGQIKLDQTHNRDLKDKAGREGFIMNQAARELRLLVSDLLVQLADKYFGTKSEERKELLDIIRKERQERKDAQKYAKKASARDFKNVLVRQTPLLVEVLNESLSLLRSLEDQRGMDLIDKQFSSLEKLESVRGELKTPTKPPKLNIKNQELYREYRDLYSEFNETIKVCREKINKLFVSSKKDTPYSIAERSFNSKQAVINSQVSRYEQKIKNKLENILTEWTKDARQDRSRFYSDAISILDSVNSFDDLESNLNNLDMFAINLSDEITIKYEARLKTIEKVEQGVNLDSAFSISEEERAFFEDKATKLQAVAQAGLSVEVLSHEIEQQDLLLRRGLNSLPLEIRKHSGFVTASNAHKALTQHIRFISSLKVSGYQSREKITGQMISEHIGKFFEDRFQRQRVEFKISKEFLNISIKDIPSRIYPVFVNILNNALHWVCFSEKREIEIGIVKGNVVIANTGPAVDEEYVPKLFELFETERRDGHGVGLYLCRENLSIANHKIWYAEDPSEMIFKNGANFVIEFNGMERE
ncbi:ATP-binding protein [Vibrio owensii]|uniref:ATP-binding protein n=1 Tax=Vibrio owensii TaxID=696485 RepID=UPI003390F689